MAQYIEYLLKVQSDEMIYAEVRGRRSQTGQLNREALEQAQTYVENAEDDTLRTSMMVQRLGTRLYHTLFPEPIAGHFREQAWRLMLEDNNQGDDLPATFLIFQPEVAPGDYQPALGVSTTVRTPSWARMSVWHSPVSSTIGVRPDSPAMNAASCPCASSCAHPPQ